MIKELLAVTGGIPLLVCDFLHWLFDQPGPGGAIWGIGPGEVKPLFMNYKATGAPVFEALWEDLDEEERCILAELAAKSVLPLSHLSDGRRKRLVLRGLLKEKRNEIRLAASGFSAFANGKAEDVNALRRLFGNKETLAGNLRSVLKLRLEYARKIHPVAGDFLKLAIENLDKPWTSVGQIRGVVDNILNRILQAECPGGKIPPSWTEKFREQEKGRLWDGEPPNPNYS